MTIPEILEAVVTNVSAELLTVLNAIDDKITGVHFEYGHPEDIIAELVNKSAAGMHYDKYPLVGLFLDFKESKGLLNGISSGVRLNMFICTGTVNTYTAKERTDVSFKPILIPIYESLIKHFLRNPNIVTPEGMLIKHDYIQRYKWGKTGLTYYNNGQANVFNDLIDAIELQNIELDFITNCITN